MKRINLRGISEILSSKELKNVTGGSIAPPGSSCTPRWGRCRIGFGHTCCPGLTCVREARYDGPTSTVDERCM